MEENKRVRKIMSVITLVVFTASNFFDSLSYVFAQETQEPLIDIGTEITAENGDEGNDLDTGNNEQQPETNTGNNQQQPGTNTGENEQQPEVNTGENEQQPEVNTGENEQQPETNTGNNQQQPGTNTGENEQQPEVNTGENEQQPEVSTGNNEQQPEINTGNSEQQPEINTGENEEEPEMNTDLWKEGEDFYDMVYTGVVKGKEYTVTLMDRNLGATTFDAQDEDSYGYFYQWGNVYPFSHHTNQNQYTNQRVDATGYGPNNRYRGNEFIKGNGDWSTVINNNLWGGEGDNGENDYYDIDADRQGPCPDGYHVPSVGEWYALLSSFLVNNGLDLASTSGLSYSDYIGKERKAAYYLESEYIEAFKEIFNITYAGRILGQGTLQRTGTTAHLWTSTPYGNESLGFEVWDDHINLGGWETVRATAYPVRCFKSVESRLIDYTITFIDGENETIEIKHWGDTLTQPEHIDKGEGYRWLGWYRRGGNEAFDFSTQITGDITLVSTWGCEDTYHIEGGECKSNTKVVECTQTGKVENSSYVVTGVEITWDTTGSQWSEIPVCEWECNEEYHLIGGQCESNTKIEECIQTGKVENSSYVVTGVEVTWDETGSQWNEVPVCEWKCDNVYTK